ncbi:MAG: hypothetical protein JNK04_00175 [Myxococcales bacterium]|nr:hypothetical protein [Myxococcales bacterium]
MVRGELVSGRFYIERSLSRGASMETYRATDSTDSSPVVVRVFPTLSTAGAAHLERVCTALWHHPHPGVEQIVAWGRGSSGEGFTVARVTDGPTFEEANSDGMRDADLHHVIRRALEALGHMHELGLAHGAVSAEVIVLPRGLSGSALLTETTLVPASLAVEEGSVPSNLTADARHLAPEQIRGVPQPSPEADIFALGCTIHHALAGSLPFAGPTVLGSHLRTLYAQPKLIESHGRAGRAALEALSRRMLAKHPAARPTARDALAELGAQASGPPSAPTLPRVLPESSQRIALILCRLPPQALSLEREGELDQAEQLLHAVGGRLDRLVSGLLLIEIGHDPGRDLIDRAGRAALMLQSVLPLSAIVVAEATLGAPADLDRLETLLGAVRPGQISVQPELIPRLGQRFHVALSGDGRDSSPSGKPAALMWEMEPETHPRPTSPRFDSEATLSESGQVTLEICVPESALAGAMPSSLEALPTLEMDLGPLAQTTRASDE